MFTIAFDDFRQMMEQVVLPPHRRSPGSDYLDPLDRPGDAVFLAFFRYAGHLWSIGRDGYFDSAWIAYCECIKPGGHDPFVQTEVGDVPALSLRHDLEARYPGASAGLLIFRALDGVT